MNNPLKKRLIKTGVLIKKKDEKKYLAGKPYNLLRLNSGERILLASSEAKDLNTAKVEIKFSSGSFNDPKQKSGLHHFYEHSIFSKKLRNLLLNNELSYNGFTSPEYTGYYIAGVLNKKYKDYGVIPALQSFINEVYNPTNITNEQFLKFEKSVINSEIDEFNSDFKNASYELFKKQIFKKDSLFNTLTLGTKQHVNSITTDDLNYIKNTFVNSKNTVINVHNYGSNKNTDFLLKQLNNALSINKRVGKNSSVNLHKQTKLKNFEKLDYFESKVSFTNNGMVTVGFVCKVPSVYFSKEDLVLDFFYYDYFSSRYFEKLRDLGVFYSGGIDMFNLSGDYNVLSTVAYVNKTKAKDAYNILVKTYDNMLKQLQKNDDFIKNQLNIRKNRVLSKKSFSYKSIQTQSKYLCDYNRLLNEDYVDELTLKIKPSDVKEVISRLLSLKKVQYKIGDI